jgi:GNAT superfamily N-acetyltransferase
VSESGIVDSGAMGESGAVVAIVRPAAAGDAEAIAGLFTDEGYPAGTSDIVERLERFDSPYSRVVVADLGGEVLGFLAVHVIPRFEHDDRIVRIVALVVDPSARERGVGHRLMAEAERIGDEVGAAFVEVTAGHHRPEARRLYESLGYDSSVTAYLRKRIGG